MADSLSGSLETGLRQDAADVAEFKAPAKRGFRLFFSRAVLAIFGILSGLTLAELTARVLQPTPQGPFAYNHLIQKQQDDFNLFEKDDQLGHRLKEGGFIGVYGSEFVSLKQILDDPRRQGRRLVLNIGDSSTSGWNSQVIVENANRVKQEEPLKSPFQSYPTYSDVLAEDNSLYVINAGVPGYASRQGQRYLERLLGEFRGAGVHVDVVTIYFGNNDSVWNGNNEDRYLLPGSWAQVHLLRVLSQAAWRQRIVPRVSPTEYAANLKTMIAACRRAGARVVLLEPPVPRVWPPGLRARGLEDEVTNYLAEFKGSKVAESLATAQIQYAEGTGNLAAGDTTKARQLLELAQETDYLVPRIKEAYLKALRQVGVEEDVPVISVRGRIPIDDRSFFCDYCHPIESTNRLIAEGVLEILDKSTPSNH